MASRERLAHKNLIGKARCAPRLKHESSQGRAKHARHNVIDAPQFGSALIYILEIQRQPAAH
jgi:hypothetical protein